MDWRAGKRVFPGLGAVLRRGQRVHDEAHPTTPEELELELAELGLSGRSFEPSEYAEALGRRLGARILFHLVDPTEAPASLRRFALDGELASARYLHERNLVLVTLPANLPPFLLALSALHELAHVAAGDVIEGRRVSRKAPLGDAEAREEEADVRARHIYLAGSLGANNPYAVALHRIP